MPSPVPTSAGMKSLQGCNATLLYTSRTPPRPTLFPYTTLFRSRALGRSTGADTSVQADRARLTGRGRSEEHTSELQSRFDLVCRLLLEKKTIHSRRLPFLRYRSELSTASKSPLSRDVSCVA